MMQIAKTGYLKHGLRSLANSKEPARWLAPCKRKHKKSKKSDCNIQGTHSRWPSEGSSLQSRPNTSRFTIGIDDMFQEQQTNNDASWGRAPEARPAKPTRQARPNKAFPVGRLGQARPDRAWAGAKPSKVRPGAGPKPKPKALHLRLSSQGWLGKRHGPRGKRDSHVTFRFCIIFFGGFSSYFFMDLHHNFSSGPKTIMMQASKKI